jgi:hypothetical protein
MHLWPVFEVFSIKCSWLSWPSSYGAWRAATHRLHVYVLSRPLEGALLQEWSCELYPKRLLVRASMCLMLTVPRFTMPHSVTGPYNIERMWSLWHFVADDFLSSCHPTGRERGAEATCPATTVAEEGGAWASTSVVGSPPTILNDKDGVVHHGLERPRGKKEEEQEGRIAATGRAYI